MQHLLYDAMFTTCRSRRTKALHLTQISAQASTNNQIIFIGHSTKEHSSIQACKTLFILYEIVILCAMADLTLLRSTMSQGVEVRLMKLYLSHRILGRLNS